MNKNIRLVFEKWDGDKPLPNCSEFFGSDGFRYEDGFFDFYERFYHSLEDILFQEHFIKYKRSTIIKI